MLQLVHTQDTPQFHHTNHVYNSQESSSPSSPDSEDFVTIAEGNENQNAEEPMNTKEILNMMVASQI